MTMQSPALTRGGQTQFHKIRMTAQVIFKTMKIAIIAAIIGWIITYAFRCEFALDVFNILAYGWAMVIESIPDCPEIIRNLGFFAENGRLIGTRTSLVLNLPFCMQKINLALSQVMSATWVSLGVFVFSFFAGLTFFFLDGKKTERTKVLGGVTLLTLKDYMKEFKKKKFVPGLEIDGIPLHKDAEVKHIMISGTTGSGKTNAMNHLLKSIRARGDKAVIVDTSGDFVAKFYQAETDKILNPLDERSKKWNMWAECSNAFIDFEDLASDFIPDNYNTVDPFWSTAARKCFSSIMKVLWDEGNCKSSSFLDLAIRMPLKKAHEKLQGTSAASFFEKDADKMALSVRATLASHIDCLESLIDIEMDDNEVFSIHQWIKDETQKGFLFLCCTPKQRTYLRPLLSAWFSFCIKSLMDQGSDYNRRIWFLVDEVASLHKLRSLEMALAEARKFGGCFVLGFQNISQIESLYGHSTSKLIFDLTATKIAFATVDAYNAKKFAEMMGEQEILEGSENISYGAHEVRDGVSVTNHKKFKALVRHCDLNELPPLKSYVKVASINHIFVHTFSYLDLPKIVPSFKQRAGMQLQRIPKREEDQEEGQMVVPITIELLEKISVDVPENEVGIENEGRETLSEEIKTREDEIEQDEGMLTNEHPATKTTSSTDSVDKTVLYKNVQF